MDAPCYKCDRRTETCHDYCKEYKEFDAKRKAISAARAKERREEAPPHERGFLK